MKKKMSFIKKISIVFWSIILIKTFSDLYVDIIEEINAIDFHSYGILNYLGIGINMLFLIIILIFFNLIRFFYLTIIYFGIIIGYKKFNHERFDLVDIKNDFYFRDIFPKYSPAVLSYVDDFSLGINDIIATILKLELKGKIKIGNKITIIDHSSDNLEDDEQYVLKSIDEKSIEDIDIFEYTEIVKNEALKHGLICEKKEIKNISNKYRLIYSVVLIFFIISSKIASYIEFHNDVILTIFVIILILSMFFIIFFPFIVFVSLPSYFIFNSLEPYVRSKEGKIVNTKLEGLRKYMLDFGEIDQKENEQLILWEDYLIYSVILGINTKVIDDIKKKMKKK